MAKAAKSSKTTTKATKAAKKTAAASGKGKENASSKKQNARSNAGKGGTKKKSGGGSAGGEGDKKKSGGITKAEQKKIDVWWEQHADSLVKTAVEDCDHWKECDAKNAVQAYRQFLIVKREMKDWENELIPCLLVSAMVEYHAHNEDFDYQSDMKLLCGHDFGDNQLVVVGKDDDFDREKATFDAVKTRFGSECDDKLWNTLPICIVGVDGGMKWDPDKWVPANEDSCFIVHRQKEECLESVFEEYIEDGDPEPLSLSNFQFLLSRTKEVIDPNDTALGLRLTYSDSDVIFALYQRNLDRSQGQEERLVRASSFLCCRSEEAIFEGIEGFSQG